MWQASLDLEPSAVERLARELSDDERARAARFHFQRDAIRFAAGRVALRAGLAECLGVEPGLVSFRYGPYGKPELAPPLDRSGLRFNASRSQGLGLFAVTRDRRVGVDIERVRPLPDLDEIAERTLSPVERRRLHRLPPTERLADFFRCWTRTEAYLKAIGTGLAGLEHVAGEPDAPARWRLEPLSVGPDYVAAIAVEAAGA